MNKFIRNYAVKSVHYLFYKSAWLRNLILMDIGDNQASSGVEIKFHDDKEKNKYLKN